MTKIITFANKNTKEYLRQVQDFFENHNVLKWQAIQETDKLWERIYIEYTEKPMGAFD